MALQQRKKQLKKSLPSRPLSPKDGKLQITKIRKKIDQIDKSLLKLLDQRAGCVAKVGEIKKVINQVIHDPKREVEILDKIVKFPHKNLKDSEVHSLFQKLIEYYRSIEKVQTLRKSANQLPSKLKVGFYGFGLIGASIGLSLLESFPHWNFEVYDPNIDLKDFQKWNKSKGKGRFKKISHPELKGYHYLFLGAPLSVNNDKANSLSKQNHIVLNLSSVLKQINDVYGFHPLAGKEESGLWSAQPDLFYGKVICLTEINKLPHFEQEQLQFLTHSLGAEPWIGSSEMHNQVLAYTSHLVQLLSMIFGMSLDHLNLKENIKLIPKTAREFLRLTGSSATMWEPIFDQNKENILSALSDFEQMISETKMALFNNNESKSIFLKCFQIYTHLYKQGGPK